MIVLFHRTLLPGMFSQVPLSCVPPCRRLLLRGSTDRLMNWSVFRPSFTLSSLDGTRDSICLHRASSAASSPRFGSSHHDERSTNDPLERITPPSLLSMNRNGLFGCVTKSC